MDQIIDPLKPRGTPSPQNKLEDNISFNKNLGPQKPSSEFKNLLLLDSDEEVKIN